MKLWLLCKLFVTVSFVNILPVICDYDDAENGAYKCPSKLHGVVNLNNSNFESCIVNTTSLWLIVFYAPWCDHCIPFLSSLETIHTELSNISYIAKVDISENRIIGNKFQITGFPTVKFIVGDKVCSYFGRRRTDEIVSYVKKGHFNDSTCQLFVEKNPFQKLISPLYIAIKHAKSGNYVSLMLVLLPICTFFAIIIMSIFFVKQKKTEKLQ
jgi:thiol-disulfide isomerase/thioredoxin